MMKNKQKTCMIIIIPILLAILLLVGCGRETKPFPQQLEALLTKADSINEISYQIVSMPSNTYEAVTMQVWLKVPKVRIETNLDDRNTVILADTEEKTGYIYIPDGNVATKTDMSNIPSSIKADTEALRKYNPSIIGTETMDSKACTVVTYEDGNNDVKAWIWNEYGIIIRSELKTPEGKVSVEIKNIDFSEIPDSIFTLPEDTLRSDWFETTSSDE